MYLVLELQAGDALSSIATTHSALAEAEQKYHQILSFAAVSGVPVHSAVLMDSSGYVIKRESYVHNEQEN